MDEKELYLKNKLGNTLKLHLRPYRKGDQAGMIACIRDEYGDTYFKQGFYNPDYLEKEAADGSITFLVAETENDGIAGMLILKQFYPNETMCEIASQIFRKKYRGYGLAMPFFEYGMNILLSRFYSAAFCLPVLFHDVTQRLLYRLGLRATGLVMNVFDMEHITHSYTNGRNTKHSQGIQIRALEKQNAGMLYIPEEHQSFCMEIYKALGVRYCITREGGHIIPPVSKIQYKQDMLQSSLVIYISQIGSDLLERIGELFVKYPLKGKQTANIFLNMSDRNAVWAYRILTEKGYFFTGVKPLCSKNEYMVLHHPGEVEIYFEDYKLSREFAHLVAYIRECYEKRKKIYSS